MLFRSRSSRRHFKTVRGRCLARVGKVRLQYLLPPLKPFKTLIGLLPFSAIFRNIRASSGGSRSQLPPCSISRSSRWRLPWATWPTAQVPVSHSTLAAVPWVWLRLVLLITPFPLTIPITSVALLNSRVLLPSDRVWCCRPFRKHFLVACLHFACFWAFSLFYPTSVLAFSLGTLPVHLRAENVLEWAALESLLFLSPLQLLSPSNAARCNPLMHALPPLPRQPFSLGHF